MHARDNKAFLTPAECHDIANSSIIKRSVWHFLKGLRLAARLFLNRAYLHTEVDEFFNYSPIRREVLNTPQFRSRIYVQQLRSSFHRNSSKADRLHFLRSHYLFLEKTHSDVAIRKLHNGTLPAFHFEEAGSTLSVSMEYSNNISREGLLHLLFHTDGICLYRAVFWFSHENGLPTLCIGSLQGAVNALDLHREFTKCFGGLRPQNMVLVVLRHYAQQMGARQLYALPKKHYFCKKISAQTDLDGLWQEQGAEPVPHKCFVRLMLESPRRQFADIPARKRSMYKKRYAFLDRFGQQLNDYFQANLSGMIVSRTVNALPTANPMQGAGKQLVPSEVEASAPHHQQSSFAF